jgi:formate hydrogenlyase transcriptional activator
MAARNEFRSDLYYRLNVFPIEIPPLRERREDIPPLVNYFVSRFSQRMAKKIKSITNEAMQAFINAPWHGNVRELENFIERCVILTPGDELAVNLIGSLRGTTPGSTLEDAERQMIIDALKVSSGRIAGIGGAAKRLGLKRTTLQSKIRELGISPADYSD